MDQNKNTKAPVCVLSGCGNLAFIYYTEFNEGRNKFSKSYSHELYLCEECADLETLEKKDKVMDWIQFDCNENITYEYTLYINYHFV